MSRSDGAPRRGSTAALAVLVARSAGDGLTRVIDLSRLLWCDPLHLAGTAALAGRHLGAGTALRVLAPVDPETRRYAARMRLGRVLDELGAEHDFPRVPERDRREDLLEVRPVTTEDDAVRLARLVARRSRATDAQAGATLFSCVAEMAQNVAEHSGTVGYVAAQTLPRQGFVRFAVADAGLGLLGTLAPRGAADDAAAVRLALAGTSRLPGAQRGFGLPTTRRVLVGAGGWLLLGSGSALVQATAAGNRRRVVAAPFPGTLVQGALRIGPAGDHPA